MSPTVELVNAAKNILIELVEMVRPDLATVSRDGVRPVPRENFKGVEVGWLTYFSDSTVSELLPPDVMWESLGSGVLVMSSEMPPTPDDVDVIDRIVRITNVLQPRGFLEFKDKNAQ
ncbi:hypothetical protein [Chitinimonas sp.]|uniref:hypothetical protein n=1 Tax=Chitinimonas sp. TaxID=1934313 RepID=UPI0035B17FFC